MLVVFIPNNTKSILSSYLKTITEIGNGKPKTTREVGQMKAADIAQSTVTPEVFARARGEISQSKGDVSLFLSSGEEVPAIKGTKLYLNDTIVSLEDSAVIANFGDASVLVLGQDQQVCLNADFFHRIDLLEQLATLDSSAKYKEPQLGGAIDIATLNIAIQADQNIETLLNNSIAAGHITAAAASNYGDVSTVVLYQKVGDSLRPVSDFLVSTFGLAEIDRINDIGVLDSNHQSSDDELINMPPLALRQP